MANKRIWDFDERTTPADTDEFECQLGNNGASRKMTLKTLNKGVYGMISTQGNTTGETTVDATPRIVTAWNTDGLYNNMTVSHANDYITCDAGFEGDFDIHCAISFSGSNGKEYQITIYKYDLGTTSWVDTGFSSDRVLGSGDVGSANVAGFVALEAGDRIAIYQSSSDGGTALTVTEAQLRVKRL